MNSYANNPPLTAEEMEERLKEYVEAVLSSRRTATQAAQQLATFDRKQQEFVLHWVAVVAGSNSEMAYQVATLAPLAMQHLDQQGIEAWILHAMDQYDNKGVIAGISIIQDIEQFVQQYTLRVTGLVLEEVSTILEKFICGLQGRNLAIKANEECYTDSETIFLPAVTLAFDNQQDNFCFLKTIAIHQWAQTWYGTWQVNLTDIFEQYPDAELANKLFHSLETIRLNANIKRELPGLFREMQRLCVDLDEKLTLNIDNKILNTLESSYSSVTDSIKALADTYGKIKPNSYFYQGVLKPEEVQRIRDLRIKQDKSKFRQSLAQLTDVIEPAGETSDINQHTPDINIQTVESNELLDGFTFELQIDGKFIAPPIDVQGTLASIYQDLGEIPDDYLVPAGPGEYDNIAHQEHHNPDDVWKGTYHKEGAFLYNEWDYERQHYRKNWCVLRERDVHPQHNKFVEETLTKHRGIVKALRRTFEALRGEDKRLKKQPFGEDIDIDAVVEAYADMKSGAEMTDELFTKMHKVDRDIAVMFMVDMSGSTKGWINDAERESLVLLCEALEVLGDRYAIYGFSGMSRKRCELFRIKRFEEDYSDEVQARISGIRPQDYTRMGVAIRHLTKLLSEVEARTKLLITLSDGKPDDYLSYRGEYGIEDTRQALFETRQLGIHPFCITIDEQASDYLPHMYGTVNYVMVADVRELPLKVSNIYRQLTT